MSARPVLAASMAQTYGLELFGAAMRRVVPLHDFLGGERHLRALHPALRLNDLVQGRSIAISLAEDGARHPDARLVQALRGAADLVERALTHARTEQDHLGAWRRMSDLLEGALVNVA